MTGRSTAALLAALVLTLAACGGGSDGGEERSGSAPRSGADAGATGSGGSSARGSSGATGKRKIDPAKRDRPPSQQASPPQDGTRGKPGYTPQPVPRKKLIYQQSRYLCGQVGLEELKRAYNIDSSDPEAVAKAVSRRTSLRGTADSVYAGCLAGLRSGD